MNTSDPGFRSTTHSPEELERFAALFIPTWELPADIAAGPDPGFKAAPMSAATVAALTPEPKPVEAPKPIKATMMGIAMPAPAPAPAPAAAPAPAPAPAPDPIVVAPAPVVAPAAPIAPPAAFRPQPVIASSIDDDLEPAPKKKGSMMFAAIGGAALLIGIGIFALTRGGEEPKAKPTETATTTEKKAMDLPEPTVAPIEAKTAEPPAKTAEPTPPPKETAAAKAPEPPPKVTAAPPPPPPAKVTAPVFPAPAKATATAAPKATAAPAKAKPKIKDEF